MPAKKIKIKNALIGTPPNPPETSDRPQGEGTDRGDWGRYADVKDRVALWF